MTPPRPAQQSLATRQILGIAASIAVFSIYTAVALIITFTSTSPARAANQEFHEVQEILREAHSILLKHPGPGAFPDSVDLALSGITDLQILSGDFSGALITATSASTTTTQNLLPQIIHAQAAANLSEDAKQTLLLCLPRFINRCLESLAGGFASSGDLRDAIGVASVIEDDGIRGFALALIAEAQATEGKIDDALLTANAIPNGSRYDTGMEWFDNRAEALLRIAIVQAEQGHWIAGVLTAGRIQDELYQSLALSRIATIIGKTGDLKTAEEIAKNIPRIDQRACALKNVALLEAKNGAWDSALMTASRITSEGKCFTYGFHVAVSASRDSVNAEIALLRAKTGDTLGARTILNQVQDEVIRHDATSKFAALLAELDDLEGAMRTLATVPLQHRDLGWSAIAISQARHLQFDEAHRTVRKIEPPHQSHRIARMIVALETGAGNSEQAIAFALSYPDLPDLARLLAEIAYQQGKAGQPSHALDTLKRIPAGKHRKFVTRSALFSITAFIAENQSSLHTPAWIDELLSLEDKPYAYMGLAQGALQKQISRHLYNSFDLSNGY